MNLALFGPVMLDILLMVDVLITGMQDGLVVFGYLVG